MKTQVHPYQYNQLKKAALSMYIEQNLWLYISISPVKYTIYDICEHLWLEKHNRVAVSTAGELQSQNNMAATVLVAIEKQCIIINLQTYNRLMKLISNFSNNAQ